MGTVVLHYQVGQKHPLCYIGSGVKSACHQCSKFVVKMDTASVVFQLAVNNGCIGYIKHLKTYLLNSIDTTLRLSNCRERTLICNDTFDSNIYHLFSTYFLFWYFKNVHIVWLLIFILSCVSKKARRFIVVLSFLECMYTTQYQLNILWKLIRCYINVESHSIAFAAKWGGGVSLRHFTTVKCKNTSSLPSEVRLFGADTG